MEYGIVGRPNSTDTPLVTTCIAVHFTGSTGEGLTEKGRMETNKIRKPKSEARKKSECRNPNTLGQRARFLATKERKRSQNQKLARRWTGRSQTVKGVL
jgi:hypothetical protein